MATDVRLDVTGLKADPNPFTRAAKGGLLRGNNVVLDRPGVARSRRGQAAYGTALSGAPVTTIPTVAAFKSRLIVHHDAVLSYDSDGAGTWVDYSGSFAARTGHRLRPVEAGGALFVASSTGVRKIDALAGTPGAAGVPKALDGDVALVAGTFMATATAVAYRLVWAITDANKREVVGAPSGRVILGNASGGARDVSHTWYIPSGITTSHRYRLYRSGPTASATDEPNDELQLVREASPTSGEVAAGQVVFTDSVPDSLRGELLYTSPSQEGIAEANERPPLASDIALFNGMLFYGDVTGRHRLQVTLLAAGTTGVRFVADNGTTAIGSPIVTGLASTANMRAGMRAKAAAGIPSTAKILTVDTANQVTLDTVATANGARAIEFQDVVAVASREYYAASAESAVNHEFLVSTGGTAAANVQATALSLVFVVNLDTGNSTVYAYYTSGFAELPGMMLFEERSIGGAAFTATSTPAAASFDPVLPATSDAGVAHNGVMVSKVDEFEAVPLANLFTLGSADKAVQRIVPLRESVLVFKEDGVWRLAGASPEDLADTVVDPKLVLAGIETAVVLANQVYAMTNRGAVSIGESTGATALNQDIHRLLLGYAALSNFAALAWAVGYESDRKWLLATPTSVSSTTPDTVFVLDLDNAQWTQWPLGRYSGAVGPDGKLYLAQVSTSQLTRERKNLTRTDYADRETALTISSSSGTTVTVVSTAGVGSGWTLVQGLRESVITSVVDATHFTVTDTLAWTAASAIAYEPIAVAVEWVPIDGNAPQIVKQFAELQLFFDESDFSSINAVFATDFLSTPDTTTLVPTNTAGAWGAFPWGSVPWGASRQSSQVIRTTVPLEAQRAHWLSVSLELSQAFASFSLLGATVNVRGVGERFRGANTEASQSPLSTGE